MALLWQGASSGCPSLVKVWMGWAFDSPIGLLESVEF
jgi:hypothetical protein